MINTFGTITVAISTGVCVNIAVAQLPNSHCDPAASLLQPIRQTWRDPRPVQGHPAAGSAGQDGAPAAEFLSLNSDPEADGPDEVAYTPDGTQVLVVHRETDNVTFFDVNTRTVTHTIGVGDFPTDVATSPNGQYAAVPNVFSNTVSIIHIPTHQVLANVPITGQQPYRVAFTPDSALIVVGVINDAVNSSFSIISTNLESEIASFPSTSQGVIGFYFTPESGGSGPIFTQWALTPDGQRIVCPNRGGSQVMIYDRATGVGTPLATATGPTGVHISNDGTVAVVAHDSPGNAISRIDLVTQTVTNTFPVGVIDGQVIRITPDKSHAIAAPSNNVIFVNLTTGAIATTIMTGSVGEVELSFDGQYAFVSNANARVIHVPTRTLVATVPFAACVEAATSPVALRAVALNTRFREDIHFYSINGATSSLEGFASTGAPPEGDAARNLALSQDGSKLVVCNNISRNVSIVDMNSKTVSAYVEVGDRPLAAAITPNGQYAVVCATDADRVRVIDLATSAVVASLTVVSRPAQVRISSDGLWAYVLNVAGADMISFIQLNGGASAVVSQVSAGQTGSAQGYAYTEVSGIELNPSGSLLAVCDSFTDLLRLYDTATRTQIAAVPVGDFPMRVAFNPAGTRAYVVNAFSDNVSVVNVNGAASSNIGTVPGIEFPLVVEVDGSGSWVYVGNTDANNSRVYVINAATNTIAGSFVLSDPARESHYSAAQQTLYLALTDGNLVRLSTASAPALSLIDSTALAAGPSDLVVNEATHIAITAQPIPDGIDIIDFKPGPVCPSDINGDGQTNVADLLGVIGAWGPCAGCPADVNGDNQVNVADLLAVIENWGACP